MPKSHQLQSLASHGKITLRSTTHITDCANEKQARLECGSERHCNKGTARTCADLPPTREAQHTTQWLPRVGQGEHWGGSLFHRIVQFGGHYPSTCMAHVKLVKQRSFLAWYLRQFFFTSGGAVCAGCAQVTLVECQESYQPGCNRAGEERKPNKPPQNQTQPKTTRKRKGSNL